MESGGGGGARAESVEKWSGEDVYLSDGQIFSKSQLIFFISGQRFMPIA